MLNFLKPKHVQIIDKLYDQKGRLNNGKLGFFLNYLRGGSARFKKCFEYMQQKTVEEIRNFNSCNSSMQIINHVIDFFPREDMDGFLLDYLAYVFNYMMYYKVYKDYLNYFVLFFSNYNFKNQKKDDKILNLMKLISHGLKNEYFKYYSEYPNENDQEIEKFPEFNESLDEIFVLLMKSILTTKNFFEENALHKMDLSIKSLVLRETRMRYEVLNFIFHSVRGEVYSGLFKNFFIEYLFLYNARRYVPISKSFKLSYAIHLNSKIERQISANSTCEFFCVSGIYYLVNYPNKIANLVCLKSFISLFVCFLEKIDETFNFGELKKQAAFFMQEKQNFTAENFHESLKKKIFKDFKVRTSFDILIRNCNTNSLFVIYFRCFVCLFENSQVLFSNLMKKILRSNFKKNKNSLRVLKAEIKLLMQKSDIFLGELRVVQILKSYDQNSEFYGGFIVFFIEKKLLKVEDFRENFREAIFAKLRAVFHETKNEILGDFLGKNRKISENYDVSEDKKTFEEFINIYNLSETSTFGSNENVGEEEKNSKLILNNY